jgi:DNA replication protein DnaC
MLLKKSLSRGPQLHSALENPTLADTIMDRLVHNAYNAYRLELKGESKRKRQKNLTQSSH